VKTVWTFFTKTRLCHKDIKPDNLVILGQNPEGALLGLIDYGFATKNDSASTDKKTTPIYGPPEANPPEAIDPSGTIDTEKFDVFCLGTLWITILFGDVPFRDE